MILDEPPQTAGTGIDSTLDDIFRAAAARRPEAVALVDPPDRSRFTDGPARRLTYAQADRVISAIAERLRALGLQPDAVVGLQIANTIDSVLAFLGVLRADLIAMPLPLLWRRADVIAAIRRTSASALIVSSRIGAMDHFDLAINAAAEAFTVRHVCGFGGRPPDGAISLDDLYAAAEAGSIADISSRRLAGSGRGAHLAAVTWDVAADGSIPVARSNAQLIIGGLAVLIESGIPQDGVILSTILPSSFGGIAMTLLPWLLVGGTLVLHHPFDGAAFAGQCRELDCNAMVLPAPLIGTLESAGLLAAAHDLNSIIAAWRGPEQLRRAPDWQNPRPSLTDVQLFGEIGLIAAHRTANGRPAAIPLGAVSAPRAAEGGLHIAETAVTNQGTLALRGPMVPASPFPAGTERTALPRHKPDPDGFLDTGCAIEASGGTAVVRAPPVGVVSFGGYRFAVGELNYLINSLDQSGTLAVRPDALAGHRLTGTAANPEAIRMALRGIGANPLLVQAFGGRSKAKPSQLADHR